MSHLLCIGHRGAMGHAPENTLASVRKALELGVHCIEVDVYCVEDELLVFHDDTLERTTNGQGKIMDQGLDYLRSLDAGDGEQIPTLSEVCALTKGRAGINIELKGPGTAAPVVRFVNNLIEQGRRREEFLISSFDHPQLVKTRKQSHDLLIGVLLSGEIKESLELARQLNAYSFHPSFKEVNPSMVKTAHKQGQQVYVYTVNKPNDIQTMVDLGVDGVFTNYPELIDTHVFPTPGWPL